MSPITCSAISAAPGVQAVICVVSVGHPCLATKEHQQQAVEKLSMGIFKEEPDSCAIKTHVIKLYIAASFFFQSGYEETIHCACSGRSEFSVWDDCKSACSYPGFRDS